MRKQYYTDVRMYTINQSTGYNILIISQTYSEIGSSENGHKQTDYNNSNVEKIDSSKYRIDQWSGHKIIIISQAYEEISSFWKSHIHTYKDYKNSNNWK